MNKVIQVLIFCMLLLPANGFASELEESLNAWRIISGVEKQNGIPKGLLHSMSLVETGQGTDGKLLPWPYTFGVNKSSNKEFNSSEDAISHLNELKDLGYTKFNIELADGEHFYNKGHAQALKILSENEFVKLQGRNFSKRFSSKAEAILRTNNLINKGIKNVDIGLMQINWYFHRENFGSVAELFDVYTNVSYAVSYLKKHKETKDWWGSVGLYHSGTKKYAKTYVDNVWKMYQKVHRLNVAKL